MPKGGCSRAHKEEKMGVVMGEFKRGTLKVPSGKKVTNKRQAIAIGISESKRK